DKRLNRPDQLLLVFRLDLEYRKVGQPTPADQLIELAHLGLEIVQAASQLPQARRDVDHRCARLTLDGLKLLGQMPAKLDHQTDLFVRIVGRLELGQTTRVQLGEQPTYIIFKAE